MGKFALQISCSSENVKSFEATGEDFRYYLKIKCSQCGEETDRFLYVCESETVQGKTGRSTSNLIAKCKNCSREWTLDIVPKSAAPYVVNEDKPEQFQTIVKFEVRGCEPTDFEFRKGWTVSSSCSSTKFEDVDLSELDWADFDEKSSESVAIMELRSQFVKTKD